MLGNLAFVADLRRQRRIGTLDLSMVFQANNFREIPAFADLAVSYGADNVVYVGTFSRIILPAILPALVTGFALAFARALGEYGSVIFIAGNIPQVSEIAPLLIIIKLEQFDYAGAAAVGSAMLVLSFLLLLGINTLQAWARSR